MAAGVADQQRIGHHGLLGDRLRQHLAVPVVDAPRTGGTVTDWLSSDAEREA